MNRGESSFENVVTPSINELTEEKVGLVALSNKKLVTILHNNLLKEQFSEKNRVIGNVVDIIRSLNKPIHAKGQVGRTKYIKKSKILPTF